MSDAMSQADESSEVSQEVTEAPHLSILPNKNRSNTQPLWHLVLLDIFTFGLYFFYWSYRNWKDLKEYKKIDINSVTKALALLIPIVGIAYIWEQFVAFRDFYEEAGVKTTFSANWVMAGFIVLEASWRLPDPYSLISFLSVVPIAMIQSTLNSAWAQLEPGLKVRKLPTIGDLLAVMVSWVIIVIIGMFFG